MSINSPVNQPLEKLADSLPDLQNSLQDFLTEYEDKVVQARTQLAHVKALLGSLPTKAPKAKGVSNHKKKALNTKRPSLFGADKDKITIGKKFDEPLTEFQDCI